MSKLRKYKNIQGKKQQRANFFGQTLVPAQYSHTLRVILRHVLRIIRHLQAENMGFLVKHLVNFVDYTRV